MSDPGGPGADADGPDGERPEPTIEPFGDAALLISAGQAQTPAIAAWARSVADAVDAARRATPAIGRPVPAHASILVPFDPLALDLPAATAIAQAAVRSAQGAGRRRDRVDRGAPAAPPDAPPTVIEIAVRYGGADGPDLDGVANTLGLRPEDVVELHAGARYDVRFLGFAPGFAYLGGLPSTLATPRRASPRERVPAGSIAIAGGQTAVYPLAMPGGWHLIGRTDEVLFDPAGHPPARLQPGMTVRFVPVGATVAGR